MRFEVRLEDGEALVVQAECEALPVEGDKLKHGGTTYLVSERRFDFLSNHTEPEGPLPVLLVSVVG